MEYDLTVFGDVLFKKKGIFECFFNAVMDNGNICNLHLALDFITDLKHGCIGRSSNLANNITLTNLKLEYMNDDVLLVDDDAMIQFAEALRRNVGLGYISIQKKMMTNIGRAAQPYWKVCAIIRQ